MQRWSMQCSGAEVASVSALIFLGTYHLVGPWGGSAASRVMGSGKPIAFNAANGLLIFMRPALLLKVRHDRLGGMKAISGSVTRSRDFLSRERSADVFEVLGRRCKCLTLYRLTTIVTQTKAGATFCDVSTTSKPQRSSLNPIGKRATPAIFGA